MPEPTPATPVAPAVPGPARYVVKRPMSAGVWLVTAITNTPDVTLDQALATLRAAPRVASATPDRMLKPHRGMPPGRDMLPPAPAPTSTPSSSNP